MSQYDEFYENLDNIDAEEIILHLENDMKSLSEKIQYYKDMVSQLELTKNESVSDLIDEYLEIIDFMQELYEDIEEAEQELKKITAKTMISLNSEDIEKNSIKYSYMMTYILYLLTEYENVIDDTYISEEEFDDLIKFIKENKDFDLSEYSDELEEFDETDELGESEEENNNIINFDDFYGEAEDEYNEIDDIKSEIAKYEEEINTITKMLKEDGIEEDFIYKVTKRYHRFLKKFKKELEEYED